MIFPRFWCSSAQDLSRLKDRCLAKVIARVSREKKDGPPATFTHSFTEISDGIIVDQVGRCQVRPLSDYIVPGMRLVCYSALGVSDGVREEAIRNLVTGRVGKYYAVGQMLGFLLTEPLRRHGIIVRNPGGKLGNVCSEQNWEVIDDLSRPFREALRRCHQDPDSFSPEDMHCFCRDHNRLFHEDFRMGSW